MSLSDPKPGGWTTKERLTSAQVNSIKNELMKCPDFSGGGTYGPSATVSIDDLTIHNDARLQYNSRTVIGIPALNATQVDSAWSFNSTAALYQTSATTAGASVWFAVKLPNPCTVTSVGAYLKGTGHSSLPATMPRVKFWARLINTDSGSASLDQADTAANAAAFDAVHLVTATGSVSVSTHHCFIQIVNESGANSQQPLKLCGLTMSITLTNQHEWPG